MTQNFDFIVFGNSVGAMVSALELGKGGKRVALVNPAPNWGGHFSGIQWNGHKFDIGMNYFEFTSYSPHSNDLLSYDANVRNDAARFFHIIETFFLDKIKTREISTIQCCIGNAFANDIIISNYLDVLGHLSAAKRQAMQSELTLICSQTDNNPLHASQKQKNQSLFFQTDYSSVSIANHGKIFHELFIEPFCQKTLNISSKNLPALLHRVAWLPLYYPETLLGALLCENEKTLPATPFHYPISGCFSECIEILYNNLAADDNIHIFQQKALVLSFDQKNYILETEQTALIAPQMVWTNDLPSLLKLAQIEAPELTQTRTSIGLVLLTLPQNQLSRFFSTLYVCDSDEIFYRVTNQDHAAQTNNPIARLTFEFNADFAKKKGIDNDDKIAQAFWQFVEQKSITMGEIDNANFVIKIFKNALPIPSLDNKKHFDELQLTAQKLFPKMFFVGQSANYTTTSFNDQFVQALQIAQKNIRLWD